MQAALGESISLIPFYGVCVGVCGGDGVRRERGEARAYAAALARAERVISGMARFASCAGSGSGLGGIAEGEAGRSEKEFVGCRYAISRLRTG